MMFYLFLIQVLSFVQCKEPLHKILIFNDMHLNPNFTTNHCPLTNCTDLGYKGEDWKNLTDSPLKLIQTVLARAKSQVDANNEKIEAIVITGDFVVHDFYKHDFNTTDPAEYDKKMAMLQAIWKETINQVATYFPQLPIFPTFGNNDNINNYQPAFTKEHQQKQFGPLFTTWFENVEATKNFLTKTNQMTKVKTTFLEGGYYNVDLNDRISIISINSIYYDDRILTKPPFQQYLY